MSSDLLNLLRQQVLLAQARILELEDVRDELAPRLAETEKLLGTAQTLVEAKIEEAAHLEKIRAALQTEFDHLRHVQHVTHEALEAARAETTAAATREQHLLAEVDQLQALIRQLAAGDLQQREKLAALEQAHQALAAESTRHLVRVQELDAEQRALKASRSWRWTTWLRALERRFR